MFINDIQNENVDVKIGDIITIHSSGFRMMILSDEENGVYKMKSNAPYSGDEDFYISSCIEKTSLVKAFKEHCVSIERNNVVIWNNKSNCKYKKYDLSIPLHVVEGRLDNNSILR